MAAVLESKTHGSDCLIVLITFITFIHVAVCMNTRGRMYDLRRARRGRKNVALEVTCASIVHRASRQFGDCNHLMSGSKRAFD